MKNQKVKLFNNFVKKILLTDNPTNPFMMKCKKKEFLIKPSQKVSTEIRFIKTHNPRKVAKSFKFWPISEITLTSKANTKII